MISFLPQSLTVALLFLTLSACQDTPAKSADNFKLIITGSSTIAPLVAEIGKRFETQYPGSRIDVQTGGSSRGIADIRQGLADIGMASRSLSASEHDLHGTLLAHDGIGIIVHQSNPLTSLNPDEIVKIYTGNVSNWEEVGGIDAPIIVLNKAEGRATLELFLHHFHLTSSQINAHVVIGDNEQGIKTVAGNPNAIAYVSIGTAEYDAAHDVPIKLLTLGEIPASLEEVQAGRFPLSRPLNLVTKTVPVDQVKTFIDFATSEHIHDLVTHHYFVPRQG
ncbi:MAG: phosphate ABC transporter substrate-binding protein [Nitrospirales bacterium]|nr:MAG: phosphate ABC transporter substrate-binding protein [Nitrospirales bacterium]